MNRTQRRQLEREQGKKIKADKKQWCSKSEIEGIMNKTFEEKKSEVEQVYKDKEKELVRVISNQLCVAFAETLHVKHGFGKKRMEDTLEDLVMRIQAIKSGDVAVEDIYKDLADKNIPVMRFEKGDE